ncbi:unnamed protein product [Ilex paraguariensis]|uniref:Uncharacterized protein n=1 Tax=Ilex paraguariensis TaxID=185542 RepID=A0ABC8T0M2_9AQUA
MPPKLAKEVFAMRRRRANIRTETYVIMKPGQNEEFVSKDELRDRLKGRLENRPSKALPLDLGRFETIDDAVSYQVRSVCELLKSMEMLVQSNGMKFVWSQNQTFDFDVDP